MQEELQPLIDRIQKEAIDTARQQSQEIIDAAERTAAKIVSDAEQQAQELLEKADKDATAFTERSQKALTQASRDVLITVGQGINKVFSDLVTASVSAALDQNTIQEMLIKLAGTYSLTNDQNNSIEVLLGKHDGEKLEAFLKNRLLEKFSSGVEIQTENSAFRGFRVSFSEGNVYHDFSVAAIAEAMAAFLRPQLSEIIQNAAQNLAVNGNS